MGLYGNVAGTGGRRGTERDQNLSQNTRSENSSRNINITAKIKYLGDNLANQIKYQGKTIIRGVYTELGCKILTVNLAMR